MTDKDVGDGKTLHIYHGSEWPEHEDFLIGNREGLERLGAAIGEALEKGESTLDAGEFIGVRCLDDAFFQGMDEVPSRYVGLAAWAVFAMVLVVLVVFVVGLISIFSWLVGPC